MLMARRARRGLVRSLMLCALVAVWAIPLALAQTPAFAVELAALPPLEGIDASVWAEATVRVPCTHATTTLARPEPHVSVWYQVEGGPYWATALAEPTGEVAALAACEGGVVTFRPKVRILGPVLAPAGHAASITLRAYTTAMGGQADPAEALSNAVPLGVAHHVDVRRLAEREASPLWLGYGGDLTTLTLSFLNLGNAEAEVTFSDLRMEPEVPVVLMGPVLAPTGAMPASEAPRGGLAGLARFDVAAPEVSVDASGPELYRLTARWVARPVGVADVAGSSGEIDLALAVGPLATAYESPFERAEVPAAVPLAALVAAALAWRRRAA